MPLGYYQENLCFPIAKFYEHEKLIAKVVKSIKSLFFYFAE